MHFVADTEYHDRGMVPIGKDCFAPGGVIHGKPGLVSVLIVFKGETDLHMDEHPELVRGADKFRCRHGAVKAHGIEAVFFCLLYVFYGGIVKGAECHVRVIMCRNSAYISADIHCVSVEENRSVAECPIGNIAEPFGGIAAGKRIKHG